MKKQAIYYNSLNIRVPQNQIYAGACLTPSFPYQSSFYHIYTL